ncbi:hypothetical protein J14TS2_14340 [Bacillus sp. J14TS2]|uniref:hypothetical protein n=1 Tax=Bacillus sp. J14TS2 TaxID=2807188 RepID=UPI001B03A8D6|nr:hypothetical protein [Bacillus sp. J14TS2]GIN70959.1 hypothetical protein J14TS2_14340 [Bacillus sp. J14TS2]
MKDDKKTVLLHEINFWKEHKILPEHYCDYLIALYTQGDENQQPKKRKRNKNMFQWEAILSLLLVTFIVVMAVITYITAISFGMQTLFLSIFVVVLIFCWFYFRKKKSNPMLVYITAAFLLLFYTVQINAAFFENKTASLYWLLLLNCMMWIVGGLIGKKLFFTLSGFIATLLLLLVMII